MSAIVFAGSLQYVGAELLASGASLVSAALISLMVNARHLFYGISMLKKYKEMDGKRFYTIFALTDETYSLVCNVQLPENVDEHWYYFLLSAMNQFYWILGSFSGGFVGNAVEFDSAGIEFSMTALFIVMLTGQWESGKGRKATVTGGAVSIICLLLFGADYFLIPSMVLITLILLAINPDRKSRAEKKGAI